MLAQMQRGRVGTARMALKASISGRAPMTWGIDDAVRVRPIATTIIHLYRGSLSSK